MHISVVQLESLSPYSQSRPHVTSKLNKEAADAYEARTWHHRLHLDDDGVVIPGMAFKNCLSEAAKFLSIQIPGKGKSTYTKHFDAGVLVLESAPLFYPDSNVRIVAPDGMGLKAAALAKAESASVEDIKEVEAWERPKNMSWGDWIFTPSDGIPGSGKRVWRCYPMIDRWSCEVTFQILDDVITQDVFKKVLEQAGLLIGIGRFRVRNRGTHGRFLVKDVNWQEVTL